MKLSLEWISSLVDLGGVTAEQLADAFTFSGSKVETIWRQGDEIQNVVVANILSVEKHPDADRLFVCRANAGQNETLQVITAATNVTPGAFVPLALDGAVLPGGVKIKSGKMRGLVSSGMFCGGTEIGLTDADEPGAGTDVLILTGNDWIPGMDIRQALGLDDTTLEFEITNNRPDCLSVLGLAREAAAVLGRPFTPPQPEAVSENGDISDMLKISIEAPGLCSRYTARMVENIKIEPSPRWMRRRLRSCGIRPINNIVDITNYVMLETGQPLHAFDYSCLKDGTLVVRTARDGEALQTLDGQERTLDSSMLVIADSCNPAAVAGVMGGLTSEITNDTQRLVFESANFNGASVRKTALRLSMRTDASSRFEKGLDPTATPSAAERACRLTVQLGAGQIIGGMADVAAPIPAPLKIPLDTEKINAFLGTAIPREEMVRFLNSLGFDVSQDIITIPSWRRDVAIWQDIAEEIARMYGYDKIPATLALSKTQGWLLPEQQFKETLCRICLSLGFDEMLTYSFIGPADYDKIALSADDPLRKCRALMNPEGEETSFMRTTALPSLLASLARNASVRNPSAYLFELATVYIEEGERLPREASRLVLGGYDKNFDFLRLKGAVEAVLEQINSKPAFFSGSSYPSYHPGRQATVRTRDGDIGVLGEIHPSVLKNYGLNTRVYACELDIDTLYRSRAGYPRYKDIPKYPAIIRDLALICPAECSHADLEALIRKNGGGNLVAVDLFDVYTDEKLGNGKRSMAYTLTFRAAGRTLRDEEVDDVIKKILYLAESKLNAVLRG
ncbi:MAG: phenylalanine--tRNA ligase subunit beta [Oscillospiraceae bacterium]|nr:phenylalanine--tRNA ligase subunit beta [Oscillospiraceae bacterium]